MNRTGLLIALGIAVVGGLVFSLYPEVDIAASRYFFDPAARNFGWPHSTADFLRDVATATIALLVAPAFIALVMKLIRPRRTMLIPPRAAIYLIATLAIGPGLVTNVILKDYWGRTRPYGITEFGGTANFVPWWDPRGGCRNNCSFVSGEPSGAFWSLAPASLAPPQWRMAAYGAALAFGAGVGYLRVSVGAHFLSDVVFAGVFMFLVIWVAHGLIYRWPRTRLDDGKIDTALSRGLSGSKSSAV